MQPPTPEPREFVMKLLRDAEATLHRQGWDKDPFLATMEWTQPGVLAFTKIEQAIPNPPGEFILALGKYACEEEPGVGREFLDKAPGFYGMAFVNEGWLSAEMTQQERDTLRETEPHKGIADLAGATEVRVINAIDLYGRHFSLHRVRGEEPTSWNDDPTILAVYGRVVHGLRLITMSVVAAMIARVVAEQERSNE